MKRLLEYPGIDLSIAAEEDKDKVTPLHIAAYAGHELVVRLLLQGGAELNKVDARGRSAANLAVEEGHVPVVKELLKQRLEFAGDPLLWAAAGAGSVDVVMLLLLQRKAGEGLFELPGLDHCWQGSTALGHAAEQGQEVAVLLLLAAGSDRQQTCGTATPLERAERQNATAVARWLQVHGPVESLEFLIADLGPAPSKWLIGKP